MIRRSAPGSVAPIALAVCLAALAGCSSGGGRTSCLDPLYACLGASGDCVAATSDARTTVTWDSEARVEGPIGLLSFEAFAPSNLSCFQKRVEAGTIVLEAQGQTIEVVRRIDGSVTVTCADGTTEEYAAGSAQAGQPGIDPARLNGCRLAGLCNRDEDCGEAQRCCAGSCRAGDLCPGECHTDADCPDGRCCEGLCTSQFMCTIPCFDDSACEDGVYCNGLSECIANRCTSALPIDCADGIGCSRDECDEAGRACTHTWDDSLCAQDEMCFPGEGCRQVTRCTGVGECPDDDVCLTPDCEGGICTYTPVAGCCNLDSECQDGRACNGSETCSAHACGAGQAPDCDDGIACTLDACEEPGGCEHQPRDEMCAPDICVVGEGCQQAPACEDDDKEENDTSGASAEIATTEVVMGRLCPADGDDWFIATARAGGDAMIVLTWQDAGDPPELEVTGISGLQEPPEAQGENMKVLLREELENDVTFHMHVHKAVSSMYAYILMFADDSEEGE